MSDKNYYEILGVSREATQDDIKTAYRKLVKQYHPDLHPDDATCAAKFKEINEANEVLSDPQKRSQYDYELDNPFAREFSSGGGGDPFGGFGDIFSQFFTGGFGGGNERAQRKGRDISYELNLSFLDAALGCTKEITYNRKDKCSACRGTGAKDGTAFKQCTKCAGSGQIKKVVGSGFFRSVSTSICDECKGLGRIITENCSICKGKGTEKVSTTIKLDIPAGADERSYIKRNNYGEAPDYGGESGNLLIYFKIAPHKLFTRKEFDVYVTLPISFKTACIGGKVKIPGLTEAFDYNVPEGTQSGKVISFKGKGIKSRSRTGDLYVTIQVETPIKLSRKQREEITKLYDDFDVKQNPTIRTYKDNMGKDFGVDPYKD